MKQKFAPTELGLPENPTQEQIDEHNKRVADKLDARLERFTQAEQGAVKSLREHAQRTVKTEPVNLPDDGPQLMVRTRIPPSMEAMIEKFDSLREDGRVSDALQMACQLLGGMVQSPPEYTNPEVWHEASRMDDAGIVWLMECADAVLAPIKSRGEAMRGNSKGSGRTRGAPRGRHTGA